MLCKFENAHFFTLSFDRILEVKVLKEHFNFPNDLFAQEFFEDSFGVMIPGEKQEVQDIVIRAKGDARFYLQDIPLHHSQHIVREDEDSADFKVHIRATEDFIGAVLQQGDRLEIISPRNVRVHMRERLQNALAPYLMV